MLVVPIFMNSSNKKKMSAYYPRNSDIYRLIDSIDEKKINKFKIYEDNIASTKDVQDCLSVIEIKDEDISLTHEIKPLGIMASLSCVPIGCISLN